MDIHGNNRAVFLLIAFVKCSRVCCWAGGRTDRREKPRWVQCSVFWLIVQGFYEPETQTLILVWFVKEVSSSVGLPWDSFRRSTGLSSLAYSSAPRGTGSSAADVSALSLHRRESSCVWPSADPRTDNCARVWGWVCGWLRKQDGSGSGWMEWDWGSYEKNLGVMFKQHKPSLILVRAEFLCPPFKIPFSLRLGLIWSRKCGSPFFIWGGSR